jgi:hypothetical protein
MHALVSQASEGLQDVFPVRAAVAPRDKLRVQFRAPHEDAAVAFGALAKPSSTAQGAREAASGAH